MIALLREMRPGPNKEEGEETAQLASEWLFGQLCAAAEELEKAEI
jgi:hypothetical protein